MTATDKKIFDKLEKNLGEIVEYKDLIENYYERISDSQTKSLKVRICGLRKEIPSHYTILAQSKKGYLMFKNDKANG